MEKNPVDLWAQVTIGASGAPTLVTANSKGIASITRNAAGTYTVTFQDSYYKLLNFTSVSQNATGISASPDYGIFTTGTNVNTQTGGTVKFAYSTGGVATDPANGDTLYLCFTVSNSSAL